MEQIKDLSPFHWIEEEMDVGVSAGHTVSECLPKRYEAYCKIFHPMYVNPTVEDRTQTWAEAQATINTEAFWNLMEEDMPTGERILWRDLTKQYGLKFHPEVNDDTFSRVFPNRSWPRYIVGADEGTLERPSCERVVKLLEPYTAKWDCYFYYVFFATQNPAGESLLYRGKLQEVLNTYDLKDVYGSPTYWWPEDKSWCVNSDYDLSFTLVGGSKQLIDSILADDYLESIKVSLEMRVDYKADKVNL